MISIIVAASINNVIGNKGKIPWYYPEDLQYFKQITMNNNIIMGKNTFLEINHPLDGRNLFVLSSSLPIKPYYTLVKSLDEALALTNNDLIICGGARLYQEAMHYCERIYLTRILKKVEGDTFFASIDPQQFKLTSIDYRNDEYRFEIYDRF